MCSVAANMPRVPWRVILTDFLRWNLWLRWIGGVG